MKIGCDEAGRGPVIGSMFITAIKGTDNQIPDIVDDSKKFSNEKVIDIYNQIKNTDLKFNCVEVAPNIIDNRNLTDISKEYYVKSISQLENSEDDTYIDSFSNNKSDIYKYMRDKLESNNIIVEFEADEKYKIVSAASIISKAKREKHIERISKKYSEDIGSGYPSDPNTRDFIREYIQQNGEAPKEARSSWKTTSDLLEEFQ